MNINQINEYPNIDDSLGLIIGARRSGSSVFAHMLATSEEANYMGETHLKWNHRSPETPSIIKQKVNSMAMANGIPFNPERITYDKCVDDQPNYVTDFGFGFGFASKIWVILRNPICCWASARRTGWSNTNMNYYLRQYLLINNTVALWEGYRDIRFVNYYDLFSRKGRKSVFGSHMGDTDKYLVNPLTGNPGFGDSSKNLPTGKLLDRSEDADVEKNRNEVHADLNHPVWKHIERIHEKLIART